MPVLLRNRILIVSPSGETISYPLQAKASGGSLAYCFVSVLSGVALHSSGGSNAYASVGDSSTPSGVVAFAANSFGGSNAYASISIASASVDPLLWRVFDLGFMSYDGDALEAEFFDEV